MRILAELAMIIIGGVIVEFIRQTLGIKITSEKISHPILVYDLIVFTWGGIISYIAKR